MKTKVTVIISMITIPLLLFVMSIRRLYKWYPPEHQNIEDVRANFNFILNDPSWKTHLARDFGVTGLCVRTICDIFPEKTVLNESEKKSILNLICHQSKNNILSYNKNKNLIFLIVESLNSTVLELDEASKVCPNLYKLANDSSSIYVPNVISQIGPGNSSDGQFIYNTGLLPIRHQPLATKYGLSPYPGIAKALTSHSSCEVIYENKHVWNHWSTTQSYGYEHLYCNISDDFKVNKNEDQFIIKKSLEIVDTISKPFFMQITTYSMHEPYDESRVDQLLDRSNEYLKDYDDKAINYLESVKFFDSQLGLLTNYLNNKNLLKQTVIVIAGDHSAPHAAMSPALDCNSVPLIIYNAGIKFKYDRTIGQVDIFPTLLDVMGVDEYILPQTGKNYRGLGKSLLNANPPQHAMDAAGNMYRSTDREYPDSTQTAAYKERWHLSELMILSRFFDK